MSTRKKKVKKEAEEKYYKPIKEKLSQLFREKGAEIYLEITGNKKKFSEELKSKISSNADIIFYFLKKFPDITGYVGNIPLPGFVVAEIKKDKIKIEDIYQTKMYADLLETKFAFLISLKHIPEEVKRLLRVRYQIIYVPSIYQAFVLTHFDEQKGEFVEWFEKNPFEESIYWR
jgi:hypothetical protein